jgi:acetyl-CoA carboxylase biotin carboxylase subunit
MRISKILIANRGEIAVRIMRTCRSMGIATVAVYSDADADAPHVRAADEAVHIGPSPSSESYLVIDKILAAARRSGADAVHPGFGFLSERAEFAEACVAAGLTFIGPTPSAIRAMGLKREAKETAIAAGVPVVPGYHGKEQEPGLLAQKCRDIGFPVLIKASAGGGGKGMRVCRRAEEVDAALESARREAVSAFGDGTLIVEKYVDQPRHVEIQILGDQHGSVVHLFERECSIQRRHQKIIEETPSTALTPALRERMGAAAVAIGKAIGYSNAGTVEFIVGPGGEFYFLEVNTRLQVEHPITECITGLDLVEEQIRIAMGEPLGYAQGDLAMRGAALECRIYAEDPRHGFLPQSGRLFDWHVPEGLPWLRVDGGVERGSDISIHYDPMIAKVITHGRTRDEATRRMIYALENLSVHGVETNREFLIATLRHPEYAAGRLHTHFIEQHLRGELVPPEPGADLELARLACIAAALFGRAGRSGDALLPSMRSGFRNNRTQDQRVTFLVHGESHTVSYADLGGGRFRVAAGELSGECRVLEVHRFGLTLELLGHRRRFRVVSEGARFFVQVGGRAVSVREEPRFPEREATAPEGSSVAPMPGKVVKVEVAEGEVVQKGQRLLVMEAMKMEHAMAAPAAGTVTRVLVQAGQQVDADQVLVIVEAS